MQAEDIPYSTYLDHRFPEPTLVRAFGPWQILASEMDGRSCLLLVNAQTREDVAVCVYETWVERQQDIWMLRRIQPGDEFGGAALVCLSPTPPPSPTANALTQDEAENSLRSPDPDEDR